MQRISVIDTHTGGEPTRVVISGGPDLGWARWPTAWPIFATGTTHFARPWPVSLGAAT